MKNLTHDSYGQITFAIFSFWTCLLFEKFCANVAGPIAISQQKLSCNAEISGLKLRSNLSRGHYGKDVEKVVKIPSLSRYSTLVHIEKCGTK